MKLRFGTCRLANSLNSYLAIVNSINTRCLFHILLQTEVDTETGEPLDTLTKTSRNFCKDLGLDVTKASEITNQVPQELASAIQKGLETANEKAVSRAARVRNILEPIQRLTLPERATDWAKHLLIDRSSDT